MIFRWELIPIGLNNMLKQQFESHKNLIISVAVIIVLGKLGLGDYMSILFTGIVAMLSLGGALAFGLGGRDAAARLLTKLGESDNIAHK